MREIPGSTLLSDIEFVAFDVETTGLSPVANRLVELSGVKFSPRRQEVETFSSLINPETPIPEQVSQIHGITDDMVVDAPVATDVVRDFLDWRGREVVFMAHNAPFDVEFMRVNLAKAGMTCPDNPVVDTLTLSRDLIDLPTHKLQSVVEALNLTSGGYHRALADSVHVKDIFLSMMKSCMLDTWEKLSIYGCISPLSDQSTMEDLQQYLPEKTLNTMSSLQTAIKTKQLIKMVYNGTFRSTRTVRPLTVIVSRGNCYLNAFCQRSKAERTFRVDRIAQLHPQNT